MRLQSVKCVLISDRPKQLRREDEILKGRVLVYKHRTQGRINSAGMLSVTGFWLSPQRRPVRCPGPAPWQQVWKGTAEPESRPSSRTQPATTAPCSASLRTTWSPCWFPRPGTGGTTEKTRRPGCKGSSGFLSDLHSGLYEKALFICPLLRRGWFPFSYTRVISDGEAGSVKQLRVQKCVYNRFQIGEPRVTVLHLPSLFRWLHFFILFF